MKGAGADAHGGLRPRFLELKRLVPKMRREHPGFYAFIEELAAAPCFILPSNGESVTLPHMPEAYEAQRNGTLLLPLRQLLHEAIDDRLNFEKPSRIPAGESPHMLALRDLLREPLPAPGRAGRRRRG